MSRRLLAGVIGLLLLNPVVADAALEYVSLVKASSCHDVPFRTQTGFRLRGVKGIYTALHGVAGCEQITVMFSQGLVLRDLEIRSVDIDKDMALLSSTELDGLPAVGLEIADKVAWNTLRTIRVLGHPFGIATLATELIVREPAIRQLVDLVPPEVQEALRQRHSPSLSTYVLSVQGEILPGHSGAPILDASDRVVAVANGGLKGGTVGIAWAIQLSSISWERSGQSRLPEIARLNPEILFSLDARLRVGRDPSDIARDEFHEAVLQFLEAANDGFVHVAKEPVVGSGSYIARIGLPVEFLTPCGVDLRKKAVCPADRVDAVGEADRQYADLLLKLTRSLQTWAVQEYQPEIGGDFMRQQDWTDTRNGQTIRLALEREWYQLSRDPRAGRGARFRTVVSFYALGYRD